MAEDETPSEAEPRGGRRKFAQDFARKYSRIATPASASKAQILKRQEELLKKDPNNVGVWFARALLLYDLGEYAEALNCLDRVLDLDPKFPGLYAARAEVLTKLGQPEGAAESMRHALEDVAAGADEGYLRALKDRTPLHEILERGLADLEREVARAEEEERAALRGMPPRLAEEDLLGRLEEEARGPPPGPRPPEPAPREPDTRERLAAWRREGFDVRPLERLLGRDPARASQAFAVFAANVEKARALQVQLGKLRRPGQEERIREALDLLRRPYDLPVYESDINDLIAGKAAPRTTEPGSKPRTRGMVNGLGRTNGLTNGMRGRTNGLVNGLRGRTNGLTNGLTNGRRGRVNGVGGRVNGLTNGMRGRTNGLVNGLRSARLGLTNGLTNGIGMTNGIGAVRSQREIRAARWKLYVVLALAVALLAVPLFSEPSLTGRLPESLITVDGTIGSDWDVATAHRVRHQENFSLLANGDIVETGLLEGVTKFGAFVRLRGDALQGSAVLGTEDTIWVFLDTDQNASTGYGVSGLGAERLVEVRGLSGTVSSALLHAYLAADGIDWFGWRAIAPVEAAVRGGILEFKFNRGALDATASPEVFVQAQAWTGRTDASDTNLALAPGRLALTWRSLAPAVVLPGVRADFLEITATALDAPVTLTRLAVTAVGTILPSSLDEVPPELVEAGGAPLGGTRTGGRTTFSPARLVDAGTSATFTLSAGPGAGSGGRTLGFVLGSVDDVGVDSGSITAAALPSARGLAHVTAPPPGTVRIDGAFGDWTPQPVTVGDVSTGGNGDIDLVSVATQVRSPSPGTSQVYAYAEVAGDLFSGTALPTRPFRRSTQAVVPDADRDTAPDLIDLFPFDFNNDGVPDNQTAGDVDGDGFLDAPAGPDLYLQTTLPGSFASPYGGKFVRIYIGPIERPPLTGEDALRVYLDADAAPALGYSVGTIYADYMIQLRGKNGKVLNESLWSFPPTASPGNYSAWEYVGPADSEKDLARVETLVTIPRDLNATIASVYFETQDARDGDDFDLRPLTRGTRGADDPGTLGSKEFSPLFTGTASNKFLVTATVDYRLDATTKQIDMRFKARIATTISSLQIYISADNGNWAADGYLQADDGSGNPTGSNLCSSTNAFNTGTPPFWSQAACVAGVSAGTTYHLRIVPTTATATKWFEVRYTTPNNQLQPYDGSADSATNVLISTNTGSSWTAQSAQPVYLLGAATPQGDPYHTFSQVTISSATGYGNKFTLGASGTYSSSEFYVRRSAGSSGSLQLRLRDVTTSTDIIGGSAGVTANLAAGSVSTSFAWHTFPFSSPVTLSSTTDTYAIWLQSSIAGTDYLTYINVASAATNPQGGSTFDGTTTFQTTVTVSGPSFVDSTKDDVPFTLVPEFSDLVLPVVATLLGLGLLRRRRRPEA